MAKQLRHEKRDEAVDDEADDAQSTAHGHGTRAVIAALLANLAVATAKFVGFAVTGSSSMLSEGVHSVADSGNQGLLLLGGRRAKKAATEEHPFGYGRERYFWSFVVALVLFSLGCLFAIYEGLHKIEHPEPIQSPQWAFGILGFAILAEGFSFRTAAKEASKIKGTASYWQYIRRAKAPELPVVLLEDLGALVGLVLAIAGVTASVVTDDGRWDGYGSVAIGILLGIIAVILVIEMKSLLIGEAASPREQAAIRAAIDDDPRSRRLVHIRTEHLGPEELLVAAKVAYDPGLSIEGLAAAIDETEVAIRAAVPTARLIYIEPGLVELNGEPGGTAEPVR